MKFLLCFTALCSVQFALAQSVEITGRVESNADVENIHVINKTAKKFTITDKRGNFKIPVKLNDSISFSSVQHKLKTIVVTKEILALKRVTVTLEEQVNTLNQVTVGKVLSGDLTKDIGSIEGEAPINFYDLGIPGYKGKLATQSERRLAAATTGPSGAKLKWYSPLTGAIPIDPIINEISGRSKMLRERVAHERSNKLIAKIRERFSESLFSLYPLNEEFRMDFFYFCEMDEDFMEKCSGTSDLIVFEFLSQKLKEYKANQNEKE